MKYLPNINLLWSSLLIEELVRNGVEHFCLSSGSRSAPLALAVASNAKARPFVHFDERAMAFHALGIASATGKSVVVITTSGTAVGNVLPAVMEASKKKLPLIVISADRPPELQWTGAHQTIDRQAEVFGSFARWAVELPCPTTDISPAYVLTTIDQAIFKARSDVKGPVHVNCAFREPLGTQATRESFEDYLAPVELWLTSGQPLTVYQKSQEEAPDVTVAAQAIGASRKGVIAVGKLGSPRDVQAVLALSEALGWPIFPDVTSGLRLNAGHPHVISYFDQLLLSETFPKAAKPECVIQFGGRMTSKRFYQWLDSVQPAHYLMVLNHSLRHDPSHQVTLRYQSTASAFVEALLASGVKSSGEISVLSEMNQAAARVIQGYIEESSELTEIRAARLITEIIPDDSVLFVGNSMPIRDVDMYGADNRSKIAVAGNRGASGIDGNIATAAGYAAGSGKVTTLVIGDLAFLYDLNALSMIKNLPKPMTIVVMNNRGGGIFSFLPVAENNPHFETFWGTPHQMEFSHAVKQFGIAYACPSTTVEFIQMYQASLKFATPVVIEVKSDRSKNLLEHRGLQERIRKVLGNI